MIDLLSFLKDLISIPGLSGYEDPAANIIEKAWQPFVNEISRGKIGSLQAFRRGTAQEPRPSVMIATHMDAIGLMVTGITEGFLRITRVGGVDARLLPGTPVMVHCTGSGNQGGLPIPGVVVQPPAQLLPPQEDNSGPLPLDNLFVDTGYLPKKVSQLVRVGDLVSFDQSPIVLSGETLAGHSLDNRASVGALTVCLDELQRRPHAWDVWAVATSQEEVGAIGASSSAFKLRPTVVVIVDVTFAKGPGASDWNTFPLDKGPTIVKGPNIHPVLYETVKKLADKLDIPYALEYSPIHSGTDGMATQVVAEGIPTLVLGIPIRYMHSSVELVALKDIQRTGRLLAEFIAALDADFMEKIIWE